MVNSLLSYRNVAHILPVKILYEYCKVFLTANETTTFSNLIDANNRGRLCYLHKDVLTCAAYALVIIQKLLENERESARS